MQAETAKRVIDYIDTLKSSGAPHQQELANDLSEIIGYYKQPAAPVADDRDAQIEQLKTNVAQLMDERDAARDMVRDLGSQLENLKATHGAARDVPEESHTSLKEASKAPSGKAKSK